MPEKKGQYVREKFKNEVAALLKKAGVSAERLESPPKGVDADISFPCFALAKEMKMNPVQIAKEIASKIKPDAKSLVGKAIAVGPYVNFYANKSLFSESIIADVFEMKENFGSAIVGKGKTVVIDFSSPNIAKPMSVGHLRSTIIGDSLHKIHNFLGYNCVGINYLGDWGTQFGKLLAAYKRWGSEERLKKNAIKELLELYVKFHKEAESAPLLEDEGRAEFKRLENGEKDAIELWKLFRNESMKEFNKMYNILNVRFDVITGESEYAKRALQTISLTETKGIAKKSDGALLIDMEKQDLGKFLLQKSDETTLYSARDMTAAIDRFENYKFDECLYVVGSDQEMHFRQLFLALNMLGHSWSKKMHHVQFGLVSMKEGKMSTRAGRVVFLEDVISEGISREKKTIEEKNPDLKGDKKNKVADAVGVGAIKFNDLSQSRIKNIIFDWDRMLDFTGDSGPYVQYTYARASSILRKAEYAPKKQKVSYTEKEEEDLLKKIAEFPDIVINARNAYEPHIIASYLIELCHAFNIFYQKHPVLNIEDTKTRDSRLALVSAARQVIGNGLNLLGIDALEEM